MDRTIQLALIEATHGRRLFSRGGEECLKNCYVPKNGSRGGDTFCLPRGGVEGRKGLGTNQILVEEKRDFCETMKKKRKVF